jgi:molybdopterin molybdotransferase
MSSSLDTVESARATMLGAVHPLGSESVPLHRAAARTLADSLVATRDQPPFRSSAMDGYAVRSADLARGQLTVVGEAAAGGAYGATLEEGEAVRIFTGAPVPAGADTVVAQERVRREGGGVFLDASAQPGKNIRQPAVDFAAGRLLIDAGTRLRAGHIALIAAAGIGAVNVSRAPRIAMLATGSEIATPGQAAGPHQIYDSVTFGLGAMVESWGGRALRLAASRDDEAAVSAAIGDAIGEADLMVIVGGASVGDYDIVKQALAARGLLISVRQVAVRPGKPTWFGNLGAKPVLGLPGNPAAAFVCAALFLQPLIGALLGRSPSVECVTALLDGQVEQNRDNEGYLRAAVRIDADARLIARPFDNQDTSLVSIFASANALIRRRPGSAPAQHGALVEVLLLDCR